MCFPSSGSCLHQVPKTFCLFIYTLHRYIYTYVEWMCGIHCTELQILYRTLRNRLHFSNCYFIYTADWTTWCTFALQLVREKQRVFIWMWRLMCCCPPNGPGSGYETGNFSIASMAYLQIYVYVWQLTLAGQFDEKSVVQKISLKWTLVNILFGNWSIFFCYVEKLIASGEMFLIGLIESGMK